jgi:hypothetical protein
VKKALSIFFIVLLLTTQYARQLSYMGCKLFYNNTTSDCGCNNIVKSTPQNDTDGPTATVHKHLHVEDFVKNNTPQAALISFKLNFCKKYFTYNSPLSCRANAELLRPPNA